jgi:hypothetical protein
LIERRKKKQNKKKVHAKPIKKKNKKKNTNTIKKTIPFDQKNPFPTPIKNTHFFYKSISVKFSPKKHQKLIKIASKSHQNLIKIRQKKPPKSQKRQKKKPKIAQNGPFFVSLRTLFWSFLPARGFAIGDRTWFFLASPDSESDILYINK